MIVVLPMAGRGSRFACEGFNIPKPLIGVAGKPMFIRALESLESINYSKLVIIALQEHEQKFQLNKMLHSAGYCGISLKLIPEVTEGQLCTVLSAKEYFKSNEGLLIIPSDTYIKSNIGEEIGKLNTEVEGLISVFDLPGDRWSFAKTDQIGNVVEVAEKERISNHASTGMYYFSDSIKFMLRGEELIKEGGKTSGEYYIIPLYQKYIQAGELVKISKAKDMRDMGTPMAKYQYENYLNNER